MAAKLGGVFLACAMGPVRQAAACILASRMPQGIEELAPDALLAAVRLGIRQAAKLAGVTPADVESVLPMDELAARLEPLRESQPAAVEAWRRHAGQLGGMLKGVADVTIDGRAILPSAALARIARKVRRDKELAAPVQAFADDMGGWEELLERCKDALDRGDELKLAYRLRRLRNAVFAVDGAAALAAVILVALSVRASRARVDAVLAGNDVCAVSGIAEADLARASVPQLRGVVERQQACASRRAWEELQREAGLRHEATAKELARLQEELDTKCEALAERAALGKVIAEDLTVAGDRKALLGRIRMRALAGKDLGPKLPALPCEGTRAEPKVREVFVNAAVATPWSWLGSIDPAAEVPGLLRPRAEEISEKARLVLAARAEDLAKRALKKGTPDRIGKALRLCALAAALGVDGGQPCEAVKELPGGKAP